MPDIRSTYQIVAEQIGAYVQPLWPGALAPPFNLRDEDGRALNSADDHLSGKSLVLVFLNNPESSLAKQVLQEFAKNHEAFAGVNATVVAISASSDATQNKALKSANNWSWPVVGDPSGAIFAAYGLHKENDVPVRIVVLTPLRQVRVWFDAPFNVQETVTVMMQLFENAKVAEEARWAPPHAPILLVPNVLSLEECGALIKTFEHGGPIMVRPPQPGEIAGNYKMPVYEHERQDRVDEIIKDKQTLTFLDQRIWGRVIPMIKKAFAFDVTRREDLHIARYVGKRGGCTMGHRDNMVAATAYRRFALSMSLNDDYDGGEIVFNEFSPRGYKPEPGTAMVFSSSLLHEIQETTKGTRYNLISHFFNDSTLPGN